MFDIFGEKQIAQSNQQFGRHIQRNIEGRNYQIYFTSQGEVQQVLDLDRFFGDKTVTPIPESCKRAVQEHLANINEALSSSFPWK